MELVRTYIRDRVTITQCGHPTACWLWVRCTRDGYGRADIGGHSYQAHRVSYEAFRSEIPAGLEIDHLCCVTNCVNPDHLEPVTGAENLRRKHERRGEIVGGKIRMERPKRVPRPPQTHCFRGHEMTPDNRILRPDARPRCRACYKLKWQAEGQRRKGRRAAARMERGGAAPSGQRPLSKHFSHSDRTSERPL